MHQTPDLLAAYNLWQSPTSHPKLHCKLQELAGASERPGILLVGKIPEVWLVENQPSCVRSYAVQLE